MRNIFRKFASVALAVALSAILAVAPALALTTVLDGIGLGTTTAPALTSCGTSPAIVGTDMAGTVTMGTGTPTGCVITFFTAKSAAPVCVVTWIATPLASQSYVTSTTAITLTQTATSSNVVKYVCIGI